MILEKRPDRDRDDEDEWRPPSWPLGPSHANDDNAPEQVPSSLLNASARTVSLGRKPPSSAENTAQVPDMLLGGAKRQALVQMLINGYAVDDLDAEVADERGPLRYLRANGIMDCMAYGMSGTRADGKSVSVMSHLSSHDYVENKDGGPTYPRLKELKDQLGQHGPVTSLAATNFFHGSSFNVHGTRKEAVSDGQVYDTVRPGQPSADYILDAERFDMHLAGKPDPDGVAEVKQSVTGFPTVAGEFRAAFQQNLQAQQERQNAPRREHKTRSDYVCAIQ
jgi:hypothetical protein